MVPSPTDVLRTEVSRTTALLRTVRRPDAPALGEWNVAELAAHLTHAWTALLALARRAVHGLPLPERTGTGLIAELDELAGMTTQLVAAEPERDLGVLADRIEAQAAAFLAELADGSEPCPWLLDGVTVDRRHIIHHLLNETVLHTYDIARADGRRWRIDATAATSIVQSFIVPVMRLVDPRSLVHQDRAAGVHTTYDVHLRGGSTFRLVLDDGRLLAPEHPDGPPDCRITADPAALLLILWGRTSPWPAVAGGRLVAWGRKPWLAATLPSMLRNP